MNGEQDLYTYIDWIVRVLQKILEIIVNFSSFFFIYAKLTASVVGKRNKDNQSFR